jgi:hypothetical protein
LIGGYRDTLLNQVVNLRFAKIRFAQPGKRNLSQRRRTSSNRAAGQSHFKEHSGRSNLAHRRVAPSTQE